MAEARPPKKTINLEEEHFLLQFRDPDTKRWTTSGPHILGHTAAFDVLRRTKTDPRQSHLGWRVVRRDIGEGYQSGWKDAVLNLTDRTDVLEKYREAIDAAIDAVAEKLAREGAMRAASAHRS